MVKPIKQNQHIWTWNGVPTDIRNLDQRQLYAIKDTLNSSERNWFGTTKLEWLNALEPVLKQHEHMNIKHIVHQQENRRSHSATGIADAVIKMFTKNDKHAINNNFERKVKANH